MTRDEFALEHETKFVRAFLLRERRVRYLEQLGSAKKRAAIVDRLNHRFLEDLDQRWVASERPAKNIPSDSHACHVIACEDDLDGRKIQLSELESILSAASFGVVISLIPGELAVYKDEAPAKPVWLQRT